MMRRKVTLKNWLKNRLMIIILVMAVCVGEMVYAEPLISTEEDRTPPTEEVTTQEKTESVTEEPTAQEPTTQESSKVTTEETTTEEEKTEASPILKTPEGLKATELSGLKVRLTWKKVRKATGYVIYRSTRKTKGFKKIGTAKRTNFTDSKVKSGKVYYYKITAFKKNKSELTSKKSDMTTVYMKPKTPKLNGRYVNKSIKLTWKKIHGAEKYYIYRKNTKGKYKKIGTTNRLYYNDKKVTEGKSYFYKVTAVYNKDGKTIRSKMSAVCKTLAMPLDPNKKMIAITFDDGPGRYTQDIVNCLKQNNAKATFFVVGCNVDSYRNALKEADKAGCEIGNHSYSHRWLNNLTKEEIKEELYRTDKKIENITGDATALIRVPGGLLNATVENTVDRPIILWSIDTRDWETRNKDKTVRTVLENVKDGDIILMHDIYEPTKKAACELIPELERRGYQLVTVSELAKYRGITLEKGKVYHSLRRK